MHSYLTVAAVILSAVAALTSAATTADHNKIVGCYWGAWAFYRPDQGKFDVDNIDPELCTHGFYGFADLSNTTWEIVPVDPWYDLAPDDCEPGYCNYDSYRRFTALADSHPNFHPIISVGGWNSGSARYSEMAADPVKKQKFFASVIPFIKKYGFHGMDFDWEYPGSREGSHPDIDKENYSVLMEELAEILHEHNLIFSAALSPGKPTIDIGYDIPRVSAALDIMNVMGYDYHGWFPNHSFTGHNSPLYRRQEEDHEGHPGYYFNVFDTIQHYIDLGAPTNKIVLGMPLYGRGFTLEDKDNNGLYCPAKDGIPKGPYTRQIGIWGFQEIQQAFHGDIKANLPDAVGQWTSVVDDCYKAPYAFNGPYWIGYDDVESISHKVQYANFLNLAGAMVWSADTDDFLGTYFNGKFPMLRAINEEFSKGTKLDPENPMCKGTAPMCDLFPHPTTTTTTTMRTTTTTSHHVPGLPCNADNEVNAYPGDCHKYYRCMDPDHDGVYEVVVYDCGDDVFDPNVLSCVDPGLPGQDLICGY